jgi:ATP-binding protein involved in chromosome partitioning
MWVRDRKWSGASLPEAQPDYYKELTVPRPGRLAFLSSCPPAGKLIERALSPGRICCLMAPRIDPAAVLDALRAVRDPDLHKDIVALGFVKDLTIDGGRVSFTIELTTPACPVKDQMRDQAREVVSRLAGVTDIQIEMTAAVRTAAVSDGPRAAIPGVKNVIAVGAGKGGVGKTTVAVNVAIALAQMGSRVGIIDGDIYGPNVPIMLGLDTQLVADEQGRIIPAEAFGVQVVSMGFMTSDDSAVIWRGPMLHGAIQQFFRQVAWVDLDYLVIDMPPGTGDVALSLSQSVPVAGSIVVTTPQQVSLADTRRAVRMYQKLQIRPLGLIENMSHFACPSCGAEADIFGHGAGEALARDMEIPFLGRLPIYQPIRVGSDTGRPIVVFEPTSVAAQAFRSVAEQAAAQVSIASFNRVIPLTPVR